VILKKYPPQQQDASSPFAALVGVQNSENSSDNDLFLDHKLDLITAGSKSFLRKHLLTKISRENCSTIISYILAMQSETNLSDDYRVNIIHKLKQLAEYHNPKPFKDMTRQDVLDFLDRFRKPENVDPLHKWVGTYEIARIILLRFSRWLYYPDLPHDKRPKPTIIL
jgi:hypothetical protein